MSTQSNAVPESSVGTQAIAATTESPTRPFYWSVRRELWESRSIYIAPLLVSAVVLVGFVITLGMPHRMSPVMGIDDSHPHGDPMQPYDIAAALFMFTQILIGAFYCLEALYGERRDRSILFWKSLPVSDATTVLSKASIPFVILPLLIFVVTAVTQFLMLLLNSGVWMAKGESVATLWTQVPLLSMWVLLLYHLVAVHTLWHAPFYGWMMLVSAWARRATLLWAILPVLVIVGLERMFNSAYFAHMLAYRFMGGGEDAVTPPGAMPIEPMTHLTPLRFLTTPGLWTGLITTAVFLAIAIRLRRSRAPI